jgi:hypothetical protein
MYTPRPLSGILGFIKKVFHLRGEECSISAGINSSFGDDLEIVAFDANDRALSG